MVSEHMSVTLSLVELFILSVAEDLDMEGVLFFGHVFADMAHGLSLS